MDSPPAQPTRPAKQQQTSTPTRPTPSRYHNPANALPRHPTPAWLIRVHRPDSPTANPNGPNTTQPTANPLVYLQDPRAQLTTNAHAHAKSDPRTASANDPDNQCTFGLTKKPR
jgi:hypothetical protein